MENLGNAPAPQEGHADESVDASGFVGMLAQGKVNEADPAGQPRTNFPQPQPKQPTPQPAPTAGGRDSATIAPGLNAIPMAREIVLTPPEPEMEPAAAVEPEPTYEVAEPASPERTKPVAGPPVGRGARRRRKVPGWYRSAVPVTFTVGGLLFLVGAWSLIAVICYFGNSTGFPGVPTHEEGILMPAIMLLSLPVAIALAVMGMIMSGQIRAEDEAEESGNG